MKILELNRLIESKVDEAKFNFKFDELSDYEPTNDEEFLGAIKYELNNYEYTMDSLVTKFGKGMMDYYKSDRKKLGVEIKKLMKSQYGS